MIIRQRWFRVIFTWNWESFYRLKRCEVFNKKTIGKVQKYKLHLFATYFERHQGCNYCRIESNGINLLLWEIYHGRWLRNCGGGRGRWRMGGGGLHRAQNMCTHLLSLVTHGSEMPARLKARTLTGASVGDRYSIPFQPIP